MLKGFQNHWRRLHEEILGMEIRQSSRSIKLHLDHYVREMLNKYKAYIKKLLQPKHVPISLGVILRPEDSPTLPDPSKQKFHRSFVAKLQFAALWIRFNVSFAVLQLARFCASAGSTHWAALHHLMEYVEGLPSFNITYHCRIKHLQDLLSGHADSDWGNSSSRQSTSGNLMLYNQAPIMWRSKMQKTTALSTAEAEYYRASTGQEVTCYTSASSLTNSASPNSLLHQCTRTTQHASSGETTSSVDGSASSTLTSGSTSLTRSSRMVKCGLFG